MYKEDTCKCSVGGKGDIHLLKHCKEINHVEFIVGSPFTSIFLSACIRQILVVDNIHQC